MVLLFLCLTKHCSATKNIKIWWLMFAEIKNVCYHFWVWNGSKSGQSGKVLLHYGADPSSPSVQVCIHSTTTTLHFYCIFMAFYLYLLFCQLLLHCTVHVFPVGVSWQDPWDRNSCHQHVHGGMGGRQSFLWDRNPLLGRSGRSSHSTSTSFY